MSERVHPLISLIVPTRGRVKKLRQFLNSLVAATAQPDRVEVILVVDRDDTRTRAFRHAGRPFKMVTVSPGQTMGALNRAGYAACSGDFIMLLNDDVIVRTRGWDEKVIGVFNTFPDRIVLVHVNDTIFEEKLCTFPFLTRTYCETAGNICPQDYARYRIDDHIYNVFDLLAVLGKKRIVYLPEVVFEHTNTGAGLGTDRYVPEPKVHAADTRHFDRLLAGRKILAIRLVATIDRHSSSQRADTRRKLLAPLDDSVALRKPEFVTVRGPHGALSSRNTRVTIGVVSADIRNEHAKTCLGAIKQHTANYELIIIDNNSGPDFNHAREMNRILSMCATDYLVLMDDDVFVNAGWLDNLLRCVTPQVGIVTPMHMDGAGELSYAGIVMHTDDSGNHAHSLQIPPEAEPVQTICSAIMLIDMAKCGHLRVDESYRKYFLDIDYGLRIWESGYQVVVSPYALVTHLGGATMRARAVGAVDELFEVQRAHFVREWMANGRYRKLERHAWKNVPAISTVEPSGGGSIARPGASGQSPRAAGPDAKALTDSIHSKSVPVLIETRGSHNIVQFIGRFWGVPLVLGNVDLRRAADRRRSGVIAANTLAKVRTAIDRVGARYRMVLVQEGYKAHNIVAYLGRFWGLPLALGEVNLANEAERHRPGVIVAKTLAKVRAAIDRAGPRYQMVLVQEGYKAHNIVGYLGQFWGLPLALGKVNLSNEAERHRPGVIVAATLSDAVAAIDHLDPRYKVVPVEEGYKAHGIVRYLDKFWGLPLALGKVDLADEAARKRPGVIAADTPAEVRAAIDRVASRYEMKLVQEGYKQYNIVRYLGRCWGLPQALGRVNLEDEAVRKRPGVIVANSPAKVRAAIDRDGPKYEVVLVQQGYKAHNIVRYLGRYWGLPLALGEVNLAHEAERQRPGVIAAKSLATIRSAIDRAGPKYEVVLVQEGYKAHNIVRYLGRYWGLPLVLGQVNLANQAERQRQGVIVENSLAKVRAAISRVGPKYDVVLVQQGYKAHNIVRYFGRYWGLPLALGEVNLADESGRQRPGVIVADTLPEVLAAIHAAGIAPGPSDTLPASVASPDPEP